MHNFPVFFRSTFIFQQALRPTDYSIPRLENLDHSQALSAECITPPPNLVEF